MDGKIVFPSYKHVTLDKYLHLSNVKRKWKLRKMKGLAQGHTAGKKGNKLHQIETRSSLYTIGGVDARGILSTLLGTWHELDNTRLLWYKNGLALFRGHSLA